MTPELTALRRRQAKAVMEVIGPLLDAWDSIPNDVRGQEELEEFADFMRQLYVAVEGS